MSMVFNNKIIILSAVITSSSSVYSFHSHPSPPRPFIHHQIISHNTQLQPLSSTSISDDIDESDNRSSSIDNNTADNRVATTTKTSTQATEDVLSEGVQKVFSIVDIDNSGSIDWNEYYLALSSTDYTNEEITESFKEIDTDGNGEISREEFQFAIQKLKTEKMNKQRIDEDCPMGYWLNSVEQTCQPLGPIGRISQQIETLPRFKGVYQRITNNFGIDKAAIRKKGVSFALAYSIISNLNGAISLSVAWYMTVKRTGISPLVPGQKKALLASYAMIYGVLQLLKPFRVAMAIGMSKLSAEYLEMTQEKFNCSRTVAIGCQYMMGQLMMGITFFVGVSIVSLLTGVPIRG